MEIHIDALIDEGQKQVAIGQRIAAGKILAQALQRLDGDLGTVTQTDGQRKRVKIVRGGKALGDNVADRLFPEALA